jgi:20S proteasome alpha/beta subunit
MTLIIAAHNDKNIVIGSDTLTTVDLDGVKQPDIVTQKIIKINKHAALGLSGLFGPSTKQFIKDFCYNNRKAKDVTELQRAFLQNVAATLILDERELLQIILVGFTNDKPAIRYVNVKAGVRPNWGTLESNFHTIGFDGPSQIATQLLREKNVEAKPQAKELKKIVKDTLNACINEFSNSNDERLGGLPKIIALPQLW